MKGNIGANHPAWKHKSDETMKQDLWKEYVG